MLNKYIDLINSPSKETAEYDDSSLGTTIDDSLYSDSDSDFYSTMMAKYRRQMKKFMSSSPLDDDSSNIEIESNSNLSESFNYDSNSATFAYSKPKANISYQSPKPKPKPRNIRNNQTASPTTFKYKTRINFNKNKMDNNQQPKITHEKNKIYSQPISPKHIHTRKHSDRKRRKKMKDFLTFDPVFNKYFYLKDKIESSDDYGEYEYSYYEDDYNDQENDDSQIQNKSDTISDIIDSNSVAQNESENYDDDELRWVETGKISTRRQQRNAKKANIWEPDLATPTLNQLSNESKLKKRKVHY